MLLGFVLAPQPLSPGNVSLLPSELCPGSQLGNKSNGAVFISFGVINTKNYK